MLLTFAWVLFIGNTLIIFGQLGWWNAAWAEPFSLAFLGTALVVWILLLIQYLQSIKWIKQLSAFLDVDTQRKSYRKVKRKWSRVTLQLFFISFLLFAYLGLDLLRLMGVSIEPQPIVTMGVWVVWLHSLLWFSLSWRRDRRLKQHLERDYHEEQVQDQEA